MRCSVNQAILGSWPSTRAARIERLKEENAELRKRVELSEFKTLAVSRLLAQHAEIELLRRQVAAPCANCRPAPTPRHGTAHAAADAPNHRHARRLLDLGGRGESPVRTGPAFGSRGEHFRVRCGNRGLRIDPTPPGKARNPATRPLPGQAPTLGHHEDRVPQKHHKKPQSDGTWPVAAIAHTGHDHLLIVPGPPPVRRRSIRPPGAANFRVRPTHSGPSQYVGST